MYDAEFSSSEVLVLHVCVTKPDQLKNSYCFFYFFFVSSMITKSFPVIYNDILKIISRRM